MHSQTNVILLVEDSADDVFFMRHALQKARITCPLQVVTDGQQAVAYLAGLRQYADRAAFPLPTVIFLDLKLPLLGGFEVLAWMRAQPALDHLPVVILTGSSEERDKERARKLGAKSYLVKPPQPATLRDIMDSLHPQPALSG